MVLSLSGMSPLELVRERFEWLRKGEFATIHASYHPEALFREHFPEPEAYAEFALEQGLSRLELVQLESVAEQIRGNLARVLTYQAYRYEGRVQHYLEITTLRKDGDVWRVFSGKRVESLPWEELEDPDWTSVEQHPDAISY